MLTVIESPTIPTKSSNTNYHDPSRGQL
jgi:hypothetical protein